MMRFKLYFFVIFNKFELLAFRGIGSTHLRYGGMLYGYLYL